MTPSEQAYMQSLIDNMYGQFVKAVADGRGMKVDDVKIALPMAKSGPASRPCP